jgi:hypothetical protein
MENLTYGVNSKGCKTRIFTWLNALAFVERPSLTRIAKNLKPPCERVEQLAQGSGRRDFAIA